MPLGTAGAVRQLKNVIHEDFLLVYGDLIFNLNLDDLISFHLQKEGVATLVVHPTDHPQDSDLLTIDDQGMITNIFNKPHSKGYNGNLGNAALFVLSPDIFSYISSDSASDFMKEVFPGMLHRFVPIYGYRTAEYIKDMGTSERLRQVSSDVESGRSLRLSKEFPHPAIYLDRDGTLIRDKNLLNRTEDIELIPQVEEGLKNLNISDYLCILATNQSVVARNLCDISKLIEIHQRLEALLGIQGAYLDDMFFCPHHPDKGYPEENPEYKGDCSCRKPKTGMIERAALRHNIDVSASWMIGDSTTDIATGIAAGMKTILLRSGKGGRDGKYPVKPDFIFDNLYEASLFIIKQ